MSKVNIDQYVKSVLFELSQCTSDVKDKRTYTKTNYCLTLNAENFAKLYTNASTNRGSMPFVVSLLGDTHAGKTTLVKSLLMEENFDVVDVIFGSDDEESEKENAKEPEQKESFHGTSANICFFRSNNSTIAENAVFPELSSDEKVSIVSAFKEKVLANESFSNLVDSIDPSSIETQSSLKKEDLDDFILVDIPKPFMSAKELRDMIAYKSKPQTVSFSTSPFQLPPSSKPIIYVLDFEGSNAVGIPSILANFSGYVKTLFSTSQKPAQEDPDRRRKAVNKLLPSLAFFLSDLIVFVEGSTFDKTAFGDKVKSFVSHIKIAAEQMFIPHLILISNFCSVTGKTRGIWDASSCTDLYLSKCDSEISNIFRTSFASVYCICLPNWNDVSFTSLNEDEPEAVKVYRNQIETLQKHISAIYQSRASERIALGFELSEKTWLDLVKLIVRDFPKSNHAKNISNLTVLDKLYQVFSSTGSIEVKCASIMFAQIINAYNSNSLCPNDEIQKKFVLARQSVFAALAGSFALRIKEKGLSSLSVLEMSSSEPKEIIQHITDYWFELLIEFLSVTEEHRICSSCIYRAEPNGKKTEIRCITKARLHNTTHHNPTLLYKNDVIDYNQNINATNREKNTLFTTLKMFFGSGYSALWEGHFNQGQNNDYIQIQQDIYEIISSLKIFLEMDANIVLLSVAGALSHAVKGIPLPVVSIVEKETNETEYYCIMCSKPVLNPSQSQSLCGRCIPFWNEAV